MRFYFKPNYYSVLILIISLLIIGCGNNNNTNSVDEYQQFDGYQKDKKINTNQTINQPKSINGVYSYSDSSVESTITVSGDSWSGKLVIVSGFGESYDNSNASYTYGLVINDRLYDESGWVELGSVNGTSLTMPVGSYNLTHYKQSYDDYDYYDDYYDLYDYYDYY